MSAEIAAGNFAQSIRDQDARQLGVRPVEHGDVADAVHESARGAFGERGEECIACLAIATGGLHLDELVVPERPLGLERHRLREARVA